MTAILDFLTSESEDVGASQKPVINVTFGVCVAQFDEDSPLSIFSFSKAENSTPTWILLYV